MEKDASVNIAIILLSHEPNDSIYQYNIAYSLRKAGWNCDVYSACDNHLDKLDSCTYTVDGRSLSLHQRSENIQQLLYHRHYSIAICDTPLAVFFAHKYAEKVVYYPTEWYPSKKNLRGLSCIARWIKFSALILASLWAGIRSDAFFFGESFKAKPFRILFHRKRYCFLPYYPRLDIFPPAEHKKNSVFTFLYAGPLTVEKGWERVKRLVTVVANQYPKKKWKLLVLSDGTESLSVPDNLTISFTPYQPYRTFCKMLYKVDLCLDLRDNDFENTRCLPVKLFHYIAASKAVLYSDLKAIRIDAPQLAEWIYLTNPDDLDTQLNVISSLLISKNDTSYAIRKAFEQTYNWNKIEECFLIFIHSLVYP